MRRRYSDGRRFLSRSTVRCVCVVCCMRTAPTCAVRADDGTWLLPIMVRGLLSTDARRTRRGKKTGTASRTGNEKKNRRRRRPPPPPQPTTATRPRHGLHNTHRILYACVRVYVYVSGRVVVVVVVRARATGSVCGIINPSYTTSRNIRFVREFFFFLSFFFFVFFFQSVRHSKRRWVNDHVSGRKTFFFLRRPPPLVRFVYSKRKPVSFEFFDQHFNFNFFCCS